MQATRVLQGGGRHYFYPKQVWSPAGGWWNMHPPNWQRNTLYAASAVGFCAYLVASNLSAPNERRPVPPIKHALSQMWSAHAEEDDPSLRVETSVRADPRFK